MSHTVDKTELIAHYSELALDAKYMHLVAHDVRNLMNTIMMASDMLREDTTSASNPQKYANMITRASEDILVILEAAVTAADKLDAAK